MKKIECSVEIFYLSPETLHKRCLRWLQHLESLLLDQEEGITWVTGRTIASGQNTQCGVWQPLARCYCTTLSFTALRHIVLYFTPSVVSCGSRSQKLLHRIELNCPP